MLLGAVLSDTKNILRSDGVESWRIDSEMIVMEAVGCTRVQLISRDDMELDRQQLDKIAAMAQRRLNREPMQYILGRCEFMGLKFKLNKDTLIPRGDTECLVELVLEHIKLTGANNVLDIGTGSGAIIVSLAVLSNIRGTAVDISENALAQAEENACLNGVGNKISFIKSDLFENVSDSFDIIVSNPPYIEKGVIPELERQVKDFEPLRALDGGDDGLKFYREITKNSRKFLCKNGFIAFEIGYNQGAAVSEILENEGFLEVTVGKDLSGLDRTVCGRLK